MEHNSYRQVTCYKCECNILVKDTDKSVRFYCQTCAWDKMGLHPEELEV